MTDTEPVIDLIRGEQAAFCKKGVIDQNTGKCRPLIKLANSLKALCGHKVKYEDIPYNNVIDCKVPDYPEIDRRFNRVHVFIPGKDCKIPIEETIFGQIQMHTNKEVGELRDRLADLELKLHVKEGEVTKLMAEKLQGRTRSEKLRCSKESCDSTFTRNEAEALEYECPACGSSITKD